MIEGHLLTPSGWIRGRVQWHAGRVSALSGEPVDEAQVRAAEDLPVVLPGFVDLHVHGGGGADTMDAGDAAERIGRQHAAFGTTSWLATTMTAPPTEIESALRALAPVCRRRPTGSARLLGVHLEGPYLSARRLGAQPPFARAATLQEILALAALAPLRVVTLAPEEPGHLALIPQLVEHGMRVQIGHTDADYELTVKALQVGAGGFTHLFNAMTPLHHRAPGAAGAALAHAEHAELIPDLLHVHPGAIRAALRAIPGLFCVTDATAAAGMPDGRYRLGRQTVTRCGNGVRLADGTLAGSTLTMDQALRNLVALGLSLSDASARTSTVAARYLGESDRGVIAEGAWADLVVLDARTLGLRQVVVEGERIEPAAGTRPG